MALDETTLEDRIQAWVTAAVTPAPVIWDRQARPQPGIPYLTLRLTMTGGVTGAVGEIHPEYAPDGPAGAEVTLASIHHHEYSIRVQAFASTPREARSLVLAVHDRAYRESGKEALRVDDPPIALASCGAVQDLGALVDTDWQGRAVLDLAFRVADVDPTDRVTYIERAGLASRLT
jgi:hypothetical protein